MSISPPTDLILDVVRAADPARRQEAMARLGTVTGIGESFGDLVDAAAESATLTETVRTPMRQETDAAGQPESAFQKFEAMMLANMIEASMPEEEASAFGSGTAGSTWKSILAEQLGMQMAKAGGIGIAEELAVRISGRAGDEAEAAPSASLARAVESGGETV